MLLKRLKYLLLLCVLNTFSLFSLSEITPITKSSLLQLLFEIPERKISLSETKYASGTSCNEIKFHKQMITICLR